MTPRRKVLLVQDDRFLRTACEASLTERGFEVVTATDGRQGLALAQSERPAAILLDLLMPKLPGIEVLRALKQHPATAAIPVVIIANSAREEDRTTVQSLGAVACYPKANLSLRALAATIERLTAPASGS